MKNRADVEAYLGGDTLQCLICGQSYRGLGHHIPHAHGISARAYKIRFGLPLSRGLVAPDVREAHGNAVHATRAAGRLAQTPPPENPAKRRRSGYAMHRTTVDDVQRLMGHLRAGDTFTQACARPGIPAWTAMHAFLQANPDQRRRLDACIEDLPFAQQARMKKLGPRFRAALATLQGVSHAEAGRLLGVSDEAVRRARKKATDSSPLAHQASA